jgi:Cytochrome oxidase complex assembly protein 1
MSRPGNRSERKEKDMGSENSSGQQKKGGGIAKWLIGGCLVLILVGGGCFAGCYFLVQGKGAESRKQAVTKLQKHTEVVEKLGEPLSFGSVTSIKYNSGILSIAFPVTGPKGTGTVTVISAGAQISSITVKIKATEELIVIVGAGGDKGKK